MSEQQSDVGNGAVTRQQRPSPRPDLHFTPVRNGMDYLVSAVNNLTAGASPPNDHDLKYAVLHLQAATEVLLKARLVLEHWSLVFKDPGSASLEKFETGKFESCTVGAAMDRLTNIARVPIPPRERKDVMDLADDRNALTHYGHTTSAFAVEAETARVLSFLLNFINDHLYPRLTAVAWGLIAEGERNQIRAHDPELGRKALAASREVTWVSETMHELRSKLGRIERLVEKRMNQLTGKLRTLEHRTIQCPDCRQWALVVGEPSERPNVACLFCLREYSSPEDAGSCYMSAFGGGTAYEGAPCRKCLRSALVEPVRTAESKDRDIVLCFNCGPV